MDRKVVTIVEGRDIYFKEEIENRIKALEMIEKSIMNEATRENQVALWRGDYDVNIDDDLHMEMKEKMGWYEVNIYEVDYDSVFTFVFPHKPLLYDIMQKAREMRKTYEETLSKEEDYSKNQVSNHTF